MEQDRITNLRDLRQKFDLGLMELQNILLAIHMNGGKDVIHCRESGTESEIFRETRDH